MTAWAIIATVTRIGRGIDAPAAVLVDASDPRSPRFYGPNLVGGGAALRPGILRGEPEVPPWRVRWRPPMREERGGPTASVSTRFRGTGIARRRHK
jgi:hypothetical protein